MKWSLLSLLTAVSLVGCGSPGANNVAACKRFVQAVKCGSVDISSAFPCDSYANTTCDISAGFDCASQYYVCTNGMYDPMKQAQFSANCASKLACK